MKKEQIFYASSKKLEFDDRGISKFELTPNSHEDVELYKVNMLQGSCLEPELYEDKIVVYVFNDKSKAVIKDETGLYEADGVCFYAPDFDKQKYTIYAMRDLEFVQIVANYSEKDRERAKDTCLVLPWFRTEAQCYRYEQDCKTPGMKSRGVIGGKFDRLGRLTLGICKGYDNCGTVEKAHPSLEQWNYVLGGSDYTLYIGPLDGKQRRYDRAEGDFDYIPAGEDHSLYAHGQRLVYYVWIEFNVN